MHNKLFWLFPYYSNGTCIYLQSMHCSVLEICALHDFSTSMKILKIGVTFISSPLSRINNIIKLGCFPNHIKIFGSSAECRRFLVSRVAPQSEAESMVFTFSVPGGTRIFRLLIPDSTHVFRSLMLPRFKRNTRWKWDRRSGQQKSDI